jgi:hypothetical protein
LRKVIGQHGLGTYKFLENSRPQRGSKMLFAEQREMPLKNARHWISSLSKRKGIATV